MNALDLFDLRGSLNEEEQLVQDSVARLVDTRVLPIIGECFEQHRFPRELVPELAALGLLGAPPHDKREFLAQVDWLYDYLTKKPAPKYPFAIDKARAAASCRCSLRL